MAALPAPPGLRLTALYGGISRITIQRAGLASAELKVFPPSYLRLEVLLSIRNTPRAGFGLSVPSRRAVSVDDANETVLADANDGARAHAGPDVFDRHIVRLDWALRYEPAHVRLAGCYARRDESLRQIDFHTRGSVEGDGQIEGFGGRLALAEHATELVLCLVPGLRPVELRHDLAGQPHLRVPRAGTAPPDSLADGRKLLVRNVGQQFKVVADERVGDRHQLSVHLARRLLERDVVALALAHLDAVRSH